MLENVVEQVIERVHPDTLKFAPFNPEQRTKPGALTKLKEAIEKAGEIIVPLIVTMDNFVADGHRRLAIARELNYESVPVIRKDWTLADLWSLLNGGNMPVGRKGWMQAVREGMPLEFVPEKDRKVISDLIQVVGRKMFEKMTDEGRGPQIVVVARAVANYCGHQNDDKFTLKVIKWFIECATLNDAKTAARTGCPPNVLIAAIEEKQKIRQSWGLFPD